MELARACREENREDGNNGRYAYGLYERNKGDFSRTGNNPLQASRLSLSKIYEKAPEILKVQGFRSLVHWAISVHPSAKTKVKTFNVSAIVAAALKNGYGTAVCCATGRKRKILYVDTEQSHYHCLKVMKRILRLAGLPVDRDNEHLEFLALRKYTPEQRIRIVEQAIYNTPDIGLVIIDGIRDMVYDINSPGESTHYFQTDAVDG